MTIATRSLTVECDGLLLTGGAYVPESPAGIVVLLHGIPSVNPPDPGDEGYPGLARRFAADGWAAVWADMRARGESPGYFSIEGWVRDALAVVEAARTLDAVADLPLVVLGSSAGGAVAVEVTARGAPIDALVLLAAPAKWLSFAADAHEGVRKITEEAGMALSPEVLADPSAWGAEFESVVAEKAIASVAVPLLILHGTADDVVPVEHARLIANQSRGADLKILEGAPHVLRQHPGVYELVLEWLERRVA